MTRLHTHDPVANFIFTEKKQKSMTQSGFDIEKSLILLRINNLSKNGPLYMFYFFIKHNYVWQNVSLQSQMGIDYSPLVNLK